MSVGTYIALAVVGLISYCFGVYVGSNEHRVEIEKYRLDKEYEYIHRLRDEENAKREEGDNKT